MPHGPNAISVIEVPRTPNGVEMLQHFRREQLRKTAIAWAVPAACLTAAALCNVIGWTLPTAVAAVSFVISGALAPGLTAVFFLRRRVANQISETLPQLASARLLGRGRDGAGASHEGGDEGGDKGSNEGGHEGGSDASLRR